MHELLLTHLLLLNYINSITGALFERNRDIFFVLFLFFFSFSAAVFGEKR